MINKNYKNNMASFIDFNLKDIGQKMYRELNIELYKKLYLIRGSELAIQKYYNEDEMKTPMHMSMGGEAISVGVCHALGNKSQVFATYRSHAAFLAKTQDTDYFFAEMYAKDISPLKGKGGSMHLCHPQYNFMGTSAIVASHIPVAVGTAFANKFKYGKHTDKIVVVFFGDGATDEGAFWESINLACLKKLPIVFVCEDNGFAVHTPIHIRRGYNSIADIISKFNCHIFESDTTDVLKIHDLASQAMEYACEPCPVFMNLKYYRYLEHVGIDTDFNAGYRTKQEFEKYIKEHKDPIELQRSRLLDIDVDENTIIGVENDIDNKVSQSIHRAKNAPFSNIDETYEHVFS